MPNLNEILHAPWLRIFKPQYRPNVAVIVQNEFGEILVCERIDLPGVNQTVQGGIDKNEDAVEAGLREASEELGIDINSIEPIAYLLERWRYDFPRPMRWPLRLTGYRGQEQQFVLVRIPKETPFRLGKHLREFRRVWWESPDLALSHMSAFKRPGIELALRGFGLIKNNP